VAARALEELTGLPAAYARLNDGQREAVDSLESTVVIAGPGSGKTETLAIKAALLLQHIPAPRGLACITYTRAAAREIRARVVELGVRPGRRLVAGTLHSFCLREILQPYAALVGEPDLAQREVVGSKSAARVLAKANAEGGTDISGVDLQVLRRASVAGEDLSDRFSLLQAATMTRYESLLADNNLIDFDGMIHEALRLARSHPLIVELTAARFPWLLVDEYQDLGAPLHVLVQTLRESREVEIFAVGDPDQTILQFTGADAEYLEALEQAGYHAVVLPINYRCAPSIVIAAASALQRDRGYKPDPKRQDDGEVITREVGGGMRTQMRVVVDDLLPALLGRFKPHEIAVLYTGKGWYADQIVDALRGGDVAYSLERDTRFSQLGEIVGWLQRSAQWSIDAWSERQGRFRDLADDLHEFLADAGHPAGRTALSAAEFLHPLLEESVDPEAPLGTWLGGLVDALGLEDILDRGGVHAQDQEALTDLLNVIRRDQSLVVQDFAGPIRRPGRIVVTTYHSSKGREFDAVILPGLQDGIMPSAWKPRGRQWRFANVDDQRKLFYVGVTRARHTLALLWSPLGENRFGDPGEWARSRFVDGILEQL
jgi:DNA helicase-2/ATP-dependent DNA helicase PcrA